MKKQVKILALAALLLTVFTGLRSAHAYFTSYTTVNGKATIVLGDTTKLKEDFVEDEKTVTLSNEGPEECFVRLRAVAPKGFEDHLTYTPETPDWYQDGEWWYYSQPIPAGGSASNLLIKISDLPENAIDGDKLNIIVMYESVAVVYKENGDPDFAESWKGEIKATTETTGGNG